MSGVPEGWMRVQMQDLVSINPPRIQPDLEDRTPLVFVPMPKVAEDFRGIDVSGRRPFSSVKRGYTQFRPGDVLFAKITPCMENGKIAIVPEIQPPLGYGSTEFFVMRPRADGLDRWIAYSVARSSFRQLARENMQGAVGQRRVPKVWLEDASVPLAPLPEQHRIVAKIESLFAKLDEGVAALKRAETNLERYRASVLKAAVEGRLTERWRAENPPTETGEDLLRRILAERRKRWEAEQITKSEAKGRKPPKNWKAKYKEPVAPDTSRLPNLPEGWCWATVEQFASTASGGTPDRRAESYFGGGIPWVKSGELGDGAVFTSAETISDQGLASSSAKVFPAGTLCIALYGATVGKLGLLRINAATNQAVCGILSPIAVIPEYLFFFLRAIRPELIRSGKGGAQPNISQQIVRQTPVALPPMSEQEAIVTMLDERFAVVRETSDRSLKSCLSAATALRQSILKRAFEGRLVPQDPADEPASVVLERIRAERAAERKRRKRRPAKPRRQHKSRVP